jgi:hypothetical protein
MVEIGALALRLALIGGLYAIVIAIWGAQTRRRRTRSPRSGEGRRDRSSSGC